MPDNIQKIRVSRVINAQKWRIFRMLTRVDEFPKYMPSVKEAVVLKKDKNKFKTRWRIQVDEVPISWVEEDVLDFPNASISFNAVEGDLAHFSGTWRLSDNPEGTLVEVSVEFAVGIPAIQQFAEPYISQMIRANFDSILESIENHLISMRYASFKKGNKDKVAGFAVLGHFYNFNHLVKCLHMLNPDFKIHSREFIAKLFNVTPSFKMYETREFKSKTGATTRGYFIVTTFIPDMVDMNVAAVYAKVVKACKLAEKYGAGIVTLGGFTSVVGERFGHKVTKEVDIPITTGNTLTAALAVDGVLKASGLMGIDLKNAKAAIIGGTGDIGSACARALAKKVKHLVITGRTKSNLRKGWLQLKFIYGARHLEATSDNVKAVRDADIVIACAAVSSSILSINSFKPGAVICDLAYPKNISYTATDRNDILIFSGGLAKMPTRIDVGIDMGLPSTDITYGNFAEAIVLALEKRYENFSEGKGNITLDKMDEIKETALKHGFEISPFYWGNRFIEDKKIFEMKKKRHSY
jgi:predicted amino acid dehydrogenase/ribosome-associated toxin RatA of RatAB toxin-antitoxin module